MRLLAVLLVATALAGCAAPEGLGLGGSDEGARDPYYKEWRSYVDGSHLMLYDAPVETGAGALKVTMLLAPRANGMPLPDLVLAKLDITVSDPDGAAVLQDAVDVERRVANLEIADPTPGLYTIQVSGVGTAGEVDGTRFGDSYTLSVEVLYP